MEFGMMQAPNLDLPPKHRDWGHYGNLGIKWCQLSMDSTPATVHYAERLISRGWKPVATMALEPEQIRNPNMLKEVEERCRAAAKVLPMVSHWEIWPEPGCPHVSQGRFSMVAYVDILKCAYNAIKEVNPNLIVYNGGIGQHGTLWGIEPFLEVALPYTDRLCLHPYIFDADPQRAANLICDLGGNAIAKMESLGYPDMKLIIGEWGTPSAKVHTVHTSFIEVGGISPVAEDSQAYIVGKVLEGYESVTEIFAWAYVYDLGGDFWGNHTGLVRVDGTPKPAYEVACAFAKKTGQAY